MNQESSTWRLSIIWKPTNFARVSGKFVIDKKSKENMIKLRNHIVMNYNLITLYEVSIDKNDMHDSTKFLNLQMYKNGISLLNRVSSTQGDHS